MSNVKVKIVSSFEGLDDLSNHWSAWQYHPNSDYLHFRQVCKQRKEIVSPYIIVVEVNDKPCTLLAGRLENTHLAPSIGYLRPVRIRAKVLMLIHQGLLGEINDNILSVLVVHIQSLLASGEIDAILLNHISEHSALFEALNSSGQRLLNEKTLRWYTHWQMALQENEGFLLARMRSKHRSWINGRQKLLDSAYAGKIAWRWITRFDNIPDLCMKLERVAALTYQRGLGAGFINNQEQQQRFKLFAERGMLRVQLLEINGEVKAYWIGTVYNGIFYSSATGYDPDLKLFELGTLIFIRMVDELVREKVSSIDFGLGDAHYKQRFGDTSYQETVIILFAANTRGMMLRLSFTLSAILDKAGRWLLQRLNILDLVKTGWRRHLRPAANENDKQQKH